MTSNKTGNIYTFILVKNKNNQRVCLNKYKDMQITYPKSQRSNYHRLGYNKTPQIGGTKTYNDTVKRL